MNQELIQYQNANQSFDEVIDNFIVRHKEFERVIDDIRTTKDGSSFQHYVFVGRRGSGKSTILRRIEAEIVKDAKLSSKYLAVNLGEEQSGIYRLYDLFDYVIRELNAIGFDINKVDFRDYKDDMKEYTKVLHAQIIETLRIKNKKLILLVDNIDRVLYNRGNTDDAALLRELLMNFKEIRIIGGSTVMSEHFWKYDMPFYQFFSIKNLEPLTLVEVEQLLNHWSEKKQLPEIKNIIKLHPGKIQSIRMLTDGLPRTMLLFVDMLINRPMQHGYEYLQIIIDKATPIYQERLGLLSPAQRKVLSELAYLWDAASVEELIPKCNMDGKTISALLHQLTLTRDVEKIKSDTKNNLYRVEERFFNLWFNMTQGGLQQRMEAKALTDFLENWYDRLGVKENHYAFREVKKIYRTYEEVSFDRSINNNNFAKEPTPDFQYKLKNKKKEKDLKTDKDQNNYTQSIKKDELLANENLCLLYYNQKEKAKLKILLENRVDKFLRLLSPDFLGIIYLYTGMVEKFQDIATDYIIGKREVPEAFLFSLLIHKQINWTKNFFEQNPKAREQYKSLYYATMSLVDNKTELLKMPPEINENVNDIISEIKEKQIYYYGKS